MLSGRNPSKLRQHRLEHHIRAIIIYHLVSCAFLTESGKTPAYLDGVVPGLKLMMTVEHHEVRPPDFSTTDRPSTPRSPPPALPPRRLPPTPQLKSNNPFYTGTGTGIASTSTSTSNEITSYQPNSSSPSKKPNSNLAVSFENPDAEYDEELSRAIQLSQQSMSDSAPHDHSHAHATDSADRGDGTTVTVQSAADVDMGGDNGDTTDHQEQGRTDRERSLRATAPPPSPEMKGLDGDSMRTLFGPSNKEEVGQTAVVPAGTYDVSDEPSPIERGRWYRTAVDELEPNRYIERG